MKALIATLLLALPVSAQTNTITFTNKGGAVIRDALVIKVDKERVLYRQPNGGGSVPLLELPSELQLRLGFDAQEFAKKKAAAQDLADKTAAFQREIKVEMEREKSFFTLNGKLVPLTSTDELWFSVDSIKTNGCVVSVWKQRYRTVTYGGGGLNRIGGFTGGGASSGEVKDGKDFVKSAFLSCSPTQLKELRTGEEKVVRAAKRKEAFRLGGLAYDSYDLAEPYKSDLLAKLRASGVLK